MREWPRLDVVVPSHPADSAALTRLLASLNVQTYPHDRLTLHVITEGNSEEAKAIGIKECRGDLIGMFCTDNELPDPTVLEALAEAASHPGVIGAYTSHYSYFPSDTSLNRYFALLGNNDPVCWWLGKADRESYMGAWGSRLKHQLSLGDNGFLIKRSAAHLVVRDPVTFGSCMDMCEDLRRLGLSAYAVISTHTIWHRTGDSLSTYLRKRWRYVNALYFDRHATRRWLMVATRRDWAFVVLFALASLLVLPQVLVSLRGYRQVRDHAWAWHVIICFALTLLYTCALLRHAWCSARSTVRRNWPRANGV